MQVSQVKTKADFDKLLRSGWVENAIEGPLSADFPDNFEELEDAFIDGLGKGEISTNGFKCSDVAQLLKKRGLVPRPQWDIQDLGQKLFNRWFLGDLDRRYDEESFDEGLELLEECRNTLPVEALSRIGGLCEEVFSVIRLFQEVADSVRSKKSYEEALNEVVYWQDPLNVLAYVSFIEHDTNTEIRSGNQLQEAASLRAVSTIQANELATLANETRMFLAVSRCFREDRSWQNAFKLNSADFGLPAKWEGAYGVIDKSGLLREALHSCFNLGETHIFVSRLPLRDIATSLKAPFSEVLAASLLHEDGHQ